MPSGIDSRTMRNRNVEKNCIIYQEYDASAMPQGGPFQLDLVGDHKAHDVSSLCAYNIP